MFTCLAATMTVSAAEVTPGDRRLYEHWCARCHGVEGDGNGPAAVTLRFNGRPPRDFRSGRFRFRSTPPGEAAADEDLARTIRDGLAASAMPYFGDLLSADEIAGLVRVVRSFGPRETPGTPVDLGTAPPDTPDLRARGEELYASVGCQQCHGVDGTDAGRVALPGTNDDGSEVVPTDLTRPWRFRGGSADGDVVHRLVAGMPGTPMPSFLGTASIEDLWAIAAYVRSLASARSLRTAAITAAKRPPGEGQAPRRRGEYLAKSGTCFLCHVQMEEDGSYAPGSFGAGGMRVEIRYVGTQVSRNLTPDDATGIGRWTAADFRRLFRSGETPTGRVVNPLDMPWTVLEGLDDRDLDALHAFFRSLPPVRNAVPPPEGPGFVETLDKIRALVTGSHERAWFGFHPGNAGRDEATVDSTENPQEWIVLAIACAILLGGVFGVTRRRSPGARRTVRLLAVVVLVSLPLVYAWPPVTLMPTDFVLARGAWEPLARVFRQPPLRPPPEPRPTADPDLAALAARGRYVARIATCPLCHTAGPSFLRLGMPFPEMGGGMKVNWKVFGTVWSRNLTPDVETGLGTWTDAEIRRAITAGIARDGRLMHWQAMPWDHFSILTPEDLDALVFYLRSLSPEWSRVPDRRPPAPADLPGDSFWLGYDGEYRPGAGRSPEEATHEHP